MAVACLCVACVWVDAHGPLYGQQMALMITLSGLRDLELFVNIFHEEKKKEMKGLGKVKEGDRREGGKIEIYQGSITKRSTQKLSLSSV